MKKSRILLCIIIIAAIAATFAACEQPKEEALGTPSNIVVSENGMLSWDEVPGATGYTIIVGGAQHVAEDNEYELTDLTKDVSVAIIATAEGKKSSAAAMYTVKGENKGTLSVPANVAVSKQGVITWDAVENAEKYIINVNGKESEVTTTSYTVASVQDDFYFSVRAVAKKYAASDATPTITFAGIGKVEVTLNAKDEIRSGKTTTLTATVIGTYEDETVTWSIVEGENYAEIAPDGKLTAYEVENDVEIVVRATSNLNPEKSDEMTITITAKPKLTAEMMSGLIGAQKIAFEGYMNIDFYTFGMYEEYKESANMNIKTAMDGEYWYARYVDGTTGLYSGLYFKNNENVASSVSVNFMNEEEYTPMLDEAGREVSWYDSGLYNCFASLTVDDFAFDEDEWKYKYVGSDATLESRMIASANPYDFVSDALYLVIEDGEIMGIYSVGAPDFTIAENYKGYPTLTVAINYGETVDVPRISKYSHGPEYDFYYEKLKTAIANMQAAENYKLKFTNYQYSYQTSKVVIQGFDEYITPDHRYFEPFTADSADAAGNINYEYGEPYGFKKLSGGGYNSYYKVSGEDKYVASRAYNADFAQTKPSFAFSEEIFKHIIVDQIDETLVTYVVDRVMTPVASTMFYGMGNDINLYGLFAVSTDLFGNALEQREITNVTVKDGYIREAVFTYSFSYFYGIVQIEYSDFGKCELPEKANAVQFEPRPVPTSWAQECFFVNAFDEKEESGYKEVQMNEFLVSFFGSEEVAAQMPFFGEPLGDTFGFALQQLRLVDGSNSMANTITFYYDVPLDVDYTINSSVQKVEKYLVSLGYEKDNHGNFVKGDISVSVKDVDLDLNIFVWKTKR